MFKRLRCMAMQCNAEHELSRPMHSTEQMGFPNIQRESWQRLSRAACTGIL